MVIAVNIVRHRGIYVARALWFVCSKLLTISFVSSRFLKEILGSLHQLLNKFSCPFAKV